MSHIRQSAALKPFRPITDLVDFMMKESKAMMASTVHGNAFTAQQYSEWIRAAGFESIRLIEPIGFQQQFVAIKPRRREDT